MKRDNAGYFVETGELCGTMFIPQDSSSIELTLLHADTFYKVELQAHNMIGYSIPGRAIFKTARGKFQHLSLHLKCKILLCVNCRHLIMLVLLLPQLLLLHEFKSCYLDSWVKDVAHIYAIYFLKSKLRSIYFALRHFRTIFFFLNLLYMWDVIKQDAV